MIILLESVSEKGNWAFNDLIISGYNFTHSFEFLGKEVFYHLLYYDKT